MYIYIYAFQTKRCYEGSFQAALKSFVTRDAALAPCVHCVLKAKVRLVFAKASFCASRFLNTHLFTETIFLHQVYLYVLYTK